MKTDWTEKYISIVLNDLSVYHNHKETMAHAAFLLQVALFGAIMSIDKWPPSWVPIISLPGNYYLPSMTVAFLGFFLVWLIIHIFIRWQLRKRRWAAIQFAGIMRVIRKWINDPPTAEDLKPYKGEKTTLSNFDLLDFLIILPKAKIASDLDLNGELSGIVEGIKEQSKTGTGAVRAERILTYGSFLILAFVLFRSLWGKKNILS
jgi:hypothetical protein